MRFYEKIWENTWFWKSSIEPVKSGLETIWEDIRDYDKSIIHLPRQNPYFCLKWLKIKAFGEWEWYLYPYFARVYRDNLKAKLSGWNLLTGLSSIKMNMKGMSDVKAGRVYSADAIEAEMKRDFGIWFFLWHIPLKQDRIWGTFMNILRMNCWYLKQLPDNGCIVRNDRK